MSPHGDLAELWVSGNAPWGVVRAVVVREPYAVVFDDMNGDLREVEASIARLTDEGWKSLAYQDDVGLPSGEDCVYFGAVDNVVFAVGHDAPGAVVHPAMMRGGDAVRCDDAGWWFFLAPGADPEAYFLPLFD